MLKIINKTKLIEYQTLTEAMKSKKILVQDIYRALIGAGLIENKSDFAQKLGANASTISAALNGNEMYLTDNFIKRIYDTFPQLPTLLQNNSVHIAQIMQGDNNGVSGSNIAGSKVTVGCSDAVLKERIRALETENALLKQRLEDKQEMIELLKNK